MAAEVGWEEAVLYVGVGSYLRPTCPRSSVDQQLPPFLASLAEQQVRVQVVLVDPQFVDGELPLALRLAPAGWAVWRPDLGQWDSLPASQALPQHRPGRTFQKGRLLLRVLPGCVEYDTPTGRRDDVCAWRRHGGTGAVEATSTALISCLYAHARAVLKRGGWVYLGIYCQPYYANEDNLAALDLYHALLDDYYRSAKEVPVDHGEERTCRLQGLVLADYADEERGTRVWCLNGRRHDQDLAVMKEVARFRGVGLNVSVPEYRYMRRQYGLGKRFGEEDGEGEGEEQLARTQAAIELAVESAGGENMCWPSTKPTFATSPTNTINRAEP